MRPRPWPWRLSRNEHVLFKRDARSALQKIVAAMPARALEEARTTAEKVRLLVQQVPDAEIPETIWRAVHDNHVLRQSRTLSSAMSHLLRIELAARWVDRV